MLIIDAPHFYAAVILRAGVVVRTAPILHYMRGWTRERVLTYCQRRNWRVIDNGD